MAAADTRLFVYRQSGSLGNALELDMERIPQAAQEQLRQLLATLPDDQANAVLNSLHDQLTDRGFSPEDYAQAYAQATGGLRQASIPVSKAPSPNLTDVTTAYQNPLAQQTQAAQPDLAQQTTLAPVTPPSWSFSTAQGGQSTDLAPEEWTQMSTLLNTDARAAYQRFAQNYALIQVPTAGTGMVVPAGTPLGSQGYTPGQPQATPGPAAAPAAATTTGAAQGPMQTQAVQTLTASRIHDVEGTYISRGRTAPQGYDTPSPRQWANYMRTAQGGIGAFMADWASSAYMDNTGQPMPDALRKQIADAVNNAPDEERRYMALQLSQQAGGTGTTSGSSASATQLPTFVTGMVQDWLAAHPTPSQQQQTQVKRLNSAFAVLGRLPTADEQTKLLTATDEQINAYIDAQPSGIKGVSYGNYAAAESRMRNYTLRYFGKTPTQDQIAWSVGRSDTQLMDWVNGSDSPISGIKMGRYTMLHDFADKLSQDLFGYLPTDSMISNLHQATK